MDKKMSTEESEILNENLEQKNDNSKVKNDFAITLTTRGKENWI